METNRDDWRDRLEGTEITRRMICTVTIRLDTSEIDPDDFEEFDDYRAAVEEHAEILADSAGGYFELDCGSVEMDGAVWDPECTNVQFVHLPCPPTS